MRQGNSPVKEDLECERNQVLPDMHLIVCSAAEVLRAGLMA